MHWEYDETEELGYRWGLEDTDGLCAFILYEKEWYICYLMHTAQRYDSKYRTLEEAKAWCKAMCALRMTK